MGEKRGLRKIVLCMGLPGSGKSTIARKMVEESESTLVRVNRDDLREELFQSVFSHANEKKVWHKEIERVKEALRAGFDVVIDDTNLSLKVRTFWEDFAIRNGATVEWLKVDTDLQECIRRDSLRLGKAHVGAAVIYNMALKNRIINWADKGHVVFDLDGTLTDPDHRLRYAQAKDWPNFFRRCDKDPVIEHVAEALRTHKSEGKEIIISTASPEDYSDLRIRYMRDHKLPFDYFFMRKRGDRREDVIIKEEILQGLPFHLIEAVYDNRTKVLDMYRAYGLNVVDCGIPEVV